MASSISKLKIAVGNYIHKKPVTHSQHHSSDKQNIMETCQNTTVSDGKIKKSASFKRTKHNIPSSLIELTIEDKQRLKHNLMMMHLHDYNLLWRIFVQEICFYTIQGHHDRRQTKLKNNLMMTYLWDHNLLWIFIKKYVSTIEKKIK